MNANEFKCAECNGVYKKGWSDEEAAGEAKEIFGKAVEDWNDEAMVICDDCFQKFHPQDHQDLVNKIKKSL